MNEILSQILPLFLLMAFGWMLRSRNMIQAKTIEEMKQLVVRFTLPSVLFLSFLHIDLKKEYLYLFIIIFLLLMTIYVMTLVLNRIKWLHHPLLPFLTSGGAFGFIGIPLFLSVYGVEDLGNYTILSVGHEVYLWLFLFATMRVKLCGRSFSVRERLKVLLSPVFASVMAGMLLNLLGFMRLVESSMVVKGVYLTVEALGSLTTPLILMILGYEMIYKHEYLKKSLKLILIRMGLLFSVGYLFKWMIIDRILPPDPAVNHAFFTFLVLPPPLVVPMFVSLYSTRENADLANNVVVLSTIISIVVYVIYVLLT
ncbi:MAG: AEC family transporter [Bacillota bacterium]|nr:AEC family transporter [Bacillota bacterium]MDW7677221.1 AEC family transporter [Bacillota bacterium]